MNDKEKMPATRWRVLCDEIRLFPPAGKLVFLCYVNKANVRTRWNYLVKRKTGENAGTFVNTRYIIFETSCLKFSYLTFEFRIKCVISCVIKRKRIFFNVPSTNTLIYLL